ncbi:MAG: DUF4231 domain-containing protein [Chloroflexota bacterium]|nr:DUF4231 domain-containing protein [Chloroflexota bacterium]
MLSSEEYIDQRLVPEIEYYENRSALNKRFFHVTSVVSIVSAVAVPIVAVVSDHFALAVIGGVASVAIASQSLFKWHENWLKFRGSAEGLKKEQMYYLTRTGPYQGVADDALEGILVVRVEDLISSEHETWQVEQKGK